MSFKKPPITHIEITLKVINPISKESQFEKHIFLIKI